MKFLKVVDFSRSSLYNTFVSHNKISISLDVGKPRLYDPQIIKKILLSLIFDKIKSKVSLISLRGISFLNLFANFNPNLILSFTSILLSSTFFFNSARDFILNLLINSFATTLPIPITDVNSFTN
jgi:hypothetical protein